MVLWMNRCGSGDISGKSPKESEPTPATYPAKCEYSNNSA